MNMKLRKQKFQGVESNNPYKSNTNYILNYDDNQDYDQVLQILNVEYDDMDQTETSLCFILYSLMLELYRREDQKV